MGRIVGLDPGAKRIGVAVSDSSRKLAIPRPALAAEGSWWQDMAQLVDEEGVDLVVVGRPVSLAGRETSSTEMAHEVTNLVRHHFPALSVEQWDERMTTSEASRALSAAGKSTRAQREIIDSAAATVMLQSYLESLR